MGNLAEADGAHLRSLKGGDRDGLAVQRDEFDFVGLTFGIDMDHGSDVARFQVFGVEVAGKNDAVVFFDHRDGPLDRKGGDQPRRGTCPFENPDRAHAGVATIRRPQHAFDIIPGAKADSTMLATE